MVKRDSLIG